MNAVRLAERRIRQSLDQLSESLESLGMTLTIKF